MNNQFHYFALMIVKFLWLRGSIFSKLTLWRNQLVSQARSRRCAGRRRHREGWASHPRTAPTGHHHPPKKLIRQNFDEFSFKFIRCFKAEKWKRSFNWINEMLVCIPPVTIRDCNWNACCCCNLIKFKKLSHVSLIERLVALGPGFHSPFWKCFPLTLQGLLEVVPTAQTTVSVM